MGGWRITVVICPVNGQRDREDLSLLSSLRTEGEGKGRGREEGKQYDDDDREGRRKGRRADRGSRIEGNTERAKERERERKTESPRTRKPVYTRCDAREVWPLLTLSCQGAGIYRSKDSPRHWCTLRWLPRSILLARSKIQSRILCRVVRNIQAKGWRRDTGFSRGFSTKLEQPTATTTPEERVFTFVVRSLCCARLFFLHRVACRSFFATLYIAEEREQRRRRRTHYWNNDWRRRQTDRQKPAILPGEGQGSKKHWREHKPITDHVQEEPAGRKDEGENARRKKQEVEREREREDGFREILSLARARRVPRISRRGIARMRSSFVLFHRTIHGAFKIYPEARCVCVYIYIYIYIERRCVFSSVSVLLDERNRSPKHGIHRVSMSMVAWIHDQERPASSRSSERAANAVVAAERTTSAAAAAGTVVGFILKGRLDAAGSPMLRETGSATGDGIENSQPAQARRRLYAGSAPLSSGSPPLLFPPLFPRRRAPLRSGGTRLVLPLHSSPILLTFFTFSCR